MTKLLKTMAKFTLIFAVVFAVYASCWTWRIARAELDKGRYVGETFVRLGPVPIVATLQLEAFDEDHEEITGVKWFIDWKGETIFGINAQESWVNVIVGNKVMNFNKGSF